MESPLSTTIGARMSTYLTNPEDFHKQRKRLNKKLLNLRHDLNIVTKDTRNYKEKEKCSKINREDYEKDARFGLILLLTAERDMLYSLEIKSLLEISNDRVSSYKNLMISKIKKSLSSAQKLLEITQGDEVLKRIELYIYTSLIHGVLLTTKKQWSKAINVFSIAKCALDFLYAQIEASKDVGDEEANQFKKTLINELLDSIVNPSLKLSVSQDESITTNTSDLKTIACKHCKDNKLPYLLPAIEIIENIDPKFVSELSSSVKLIDSIQWRGHEAKLYNDELSFNIMKLTDENETHWKQYEDVNQYDTLLSGWTESLEIHKTDMEKNANEDDLEVVQNRAIVLTYINYNFLFTRLKRDLLIVEQLRATCLFESNKDIIRLYSTIELTINELKELPGVYNDEALYNSLKNLQEYFAAKRSITIGDCFRKLEKFPEALKIYSSIYNKFESVKGNFYEVDNFPYQITDNKEFESFLNDLKDILFRTHVAAQFYHELANSGEVFTAENMHRYSNADLKAIVNLNDKAKVQPILSKPVLFDIGYNYINYDLGRSSSSSSNFATKSTSDDTEKKRSGFFGIFGRSS